MAQARLLAVTAASDPSTRPPKPPAHSSQGTPHLAQHRKEKAWTPCPCGYRQDGQGRPPAGFLCAGQKGEVVSKVTGRPSHVFTGPNCSAWSQDPGFKSQLSPPPAAILGASVSLSLGGRGAGGHGH